jgi:hypothetical protein
VTLDEFLAGAVDDCVNGGSDRLLDPPAAPFIPPIGDEDLVDAGAINDPPEAGWFVGGHDHGPAGEHGGHPHEHIDGGFLGDCDRYPGEDHRHELVRFSGDQRDHDVRAVQLRPDNFSPKMIEKAGRLAAAGAWSDLGDGRFEVLGDSGDWYQVRVFGCQTWFAVCSCRAQASRWNRAGACSHRALGGWLQAQASGQPIPRWPALTMPVLTTEEPSR